MDMRNREKTSNRLGNRLRPPNMRAQYLPRIHKIFLDPGESRIEELSFDWVKKPFSR